MIFTLSTCQCAMVCYRSLIINDPGYAIAIIKRRFVDIDVYLLIEEMTCLLSLFATNYPICVKATCSPTGNSGCRYPYS
jgi:hypothetical protein